MKLDTSSSPRPSSAHRHLHLLLLFPLPFLCGFPNRFQAMELSFAVFLVFLSLLHRPLVPPSPLSLSPSLTYSLSPNDACKHRSRMAQAANFREDVLSRAAYGRRLYQSSAGNSEGKSRSCEWCGESKRKKGRATSVEQRFPRSPDRRSCCRSRSRTPEHSIGSDDLT